MIRWFRSGDSHKWAHRWQEKWLRTSLAFGRSTVTAHLRIPANRHRGESGFERAMWSVKLPGPGGRLVLLAQLAANALDGPAWLPAWAARSLVPEIAHRCDPVPGEPGFVDWLAATAASSDDGWYTAGCVLARQLTLTDLATHRIRIAQNAKPRSGYFPLPPDTEVPVPLAPGTYNVAEVASAFGVAVPDVVPLVDELLWAGVIVLTKAE